jgi:hypothetical protein
MQKQRLTLWLTGLLVATLVLAGCAPRATSGEVGAQAGDAGIVIDLPAIVVDFDAAGKPSVGNVPIAQLSSVLPGIGLEGLAMDAAMVDYFTTSKIQHIQIDMSSTGLLLIVNGRLIPSVRWDGSVLSQTGDLINALGAGVPLLEKVLPMLTNLGVGVILRFPLAAGVEAVPTYVVDQAALAAAEAAQAEFLASVGDTPPTIKIPVFYDADGGWRVGDLTDAEWTSLTGMPFNSVRLSPEMIANMQKAGINELSVYTDDSGIHLSINDMNLPYIGWSQGEINNVLALADELGLWSTLADSGMNVGEIVVMVESLLPIVQSTNTTVNVFLPSSVAAAR